VPDGRYEGGWEDGAVRRKPLLRVRKTGALLVAAVIAFVGTVPLAGASRPLALVLLIPAAVIVWAWRAGTDVYADELRVKALLGRTRVPWASILQMAPDERGQVSALLDNGNAIRLTGVTRDNLSRVLAAAGHQVSDPRNSAD
jgi:Bacterial PH domain